MILVLVAPVRNIKSAAAGIKQRLISYQVSRARLDYFIRYIV